ncbi:MULTISPECIES: tRNA uracil 4-sulfurtransferase ThiI [Laceyella]|jgi:thiamine biosynthesis protein ThiI|uniref:Probable tRNA sulfurtransferase n=1 Tax=Laceyella sacchari TaxID=37482 RepID=A0ABY5TZE4_LACSH|nr:tRNA uracil 4-sulfurtransferase ThiI [Laceyella sacchari]MRG29274.1 tRNA 4-thiouridine(8) synthase ThiI [Laceyella tengchongensis]TCW37635.1 thiamine biosynthesis protein ThiI [Laceyella sacchari]UWE02787.1 tRNA 4-thiouridine(8) synthase ThiI [Laceyella sacchari]
MKRNCILVRYGELALKGKNKAEFEDRLVKNIRDKVRRFPGVQVNKTHGRIFIEFGEQAVEPILEEVSQVFGLVGISPAIRVASDWEEIKGAVRELVESQRDAVRTFKVNSKRANKTFPLGSQEMNHRLGGYLLGMFPQLKVDVHNPELTVHVEVRGKYSYVYGNDINGPGGLPVGVSGRVMLLLSGGIDSPVAGYLALKRGAELHAIHFHSYPFTSERAKQKVIDLAQTLTRYGGRIKLHVVPFTEIQTEINKHCFESYSITVMRRIMLRISEEVAKRNGALALVTGESLGQVASQTLESMNAINDVTRMPILRPVIGMDKHEIMNIAKRIGTYETSILPYEDCCTVFLPKAPKTKPDKEVARAQEAKLDLERLIQEAVDGVEVIDLVPEQPDEELSYF